jgi:hypothetical protein
MEGNKGQIVTIASNDQNDPVSMLRLAYQHFNQRNIDAALALMHQEVDWPNGMEGGIEHGHESVRNYWLRQWTLIDPHVKPIDFRLQEDGRIDVTVHQVVRDMQGKLLVDQLIHHIYTVENYLIKTMQIQKQK